jgi:hypothetical protein
MFDLIEDRFALDKIFSPPPMSIFFVIRGTTQLAPTAWGNGSSMS